jgi:hypothetical protein
MQFDDFLTLLPIQRQAAETETDFRDRVRLAVSAEAKMAKFASSNSHNSPGRYNKVGQEAAATAVRLLEKRFDEIIEQVRKEVANRLGECADKPDMIAALPEPKPFIRACVRKVYTDRFEETWREIWDGLCGRYPELEFYGSSPLEGR